LRRIIRASASTPTFFGMKAGSARWNVLLLAVALARAAWAAGTAEAEPPLAVPALAGNEAEPQRDLRWRNAALASGTALAVAYYGRRNWWQDGFAGEFRSRSEGWFGRNTENGGADKLGHAMFTYAGVRLGTRAYEGLGNSPQAARRLGFWTALGTMTAVEIADGSLPPTWRATPTASPPPKSGIW
jgi:hypothetical protein